MYEPTHDFRKKLEYKYKWEDLTEDELRCLWVLEEFLAEQGMRAYHLPSEPYPKRFSESHGFLFPLNRTFGSYDGSGLAALTVAAFTAHVRVELSVSQTWTLFNEDYEFVSLEWLEDADWQLTDDGEHGEVMTLRLSPRKPKGCHTFERHPGISYLTDMIGRLDPTVVDLQVAA